MEAFKDSWGRSILTPGFTPLFVEQPRLNRVWWKPLRQEKSFTTQFLVFLHLCLWHCLLTVTVMDCGGKWTNLRQEEMKRGETNLGQEDIEVTLVGKDDTWLPDLPQAQDWFTELLFCLIHSDQHCLWWVPISKWKNINSTQLSLIQNNLSRHLLTFNINKKKHSNFIEDFSLHVHTFVKSTSNTN